MMRLGGIPFFISCSIIALTGRRQRNGSVKGGGAEGQHPRPGGAHRTLSTSGRGRSQRSQGPNALGFSQGEKVGWDHRRAERKERWKEDICSCPSEGEAPRSSALPSPQSFLLFSAAFLIPASSSGASGVNPIRSNLGEEAGSAPNPGCGEVGAGCALPFPRLLQGSGFWLFFPPSLSLPKIHPQRGPTHPCHPKH